MWQPDQERLKELAFLLEATQQPGNNHREALERLESAKRHEDCNNYFAFLFALGTDYSEVVCHCALFFPLQGAFVTNWCCGGTSASSGSVCGVLRKCHDWNRHFSSILLLYPILKLPC